jgi:predicted extracellular nuclease
MKNASRIKIISVVALARAMFMLVAPASAQTAQADAALRSPRLRASESVRGGTVITSDGEVAVTSIDRKWDEKTGTGTLNEAATRPDGRVYSREANLTRNPDRSITERGTMTDFDGRPANYIETTTQTASGPVSVGKIVGVDGKVSTYETTTARSARNQTKRTTIITHADGTKEIRVEILAPAKTTAISD